MDLTVVKAFVRDQEMVVIAEMQTNVAYVAHEQHSLNLIFDVFVAIKMVDGKPFVQIREEVNLIAICNKVPRVGDLIGFRSDHVGKAV